HVRHRPGGPLRLRRRRHLLGPRRAPLSVRGSPYRPRPRPTRGPKAPSPNRRLHQGRPLSTEPPARPPAGEGGALSQAPPPPPPPPPQASRIGEPAARAATLPRPRCGRLPGWRPRAERPEPRPHPRGRDVPGQPGTHLPRRGRTAAQRTTRAGGPEPHREHGLRRLLRTRRPRRRHAAHPHARERLHLQLADRLRSR